MECNIYKNILNSNLKNTRNDDFEMEGFLFYFM
jgi:hypothetical protein